MCSVWIEVLQRNLFSDMPTLSLVLCMIMNRIYWSYAALCRTSGVGSTVTIFTSASSMTSSAQTDDLLAASLQTLRISGECHN